MYAAIDRDFNLEQAIGLFSNMSSFDRASIMPLIVGEENSAMLRLKREDCRFLGLGSVVAELYPAYMCADKDGHIDREFPRYETFQQPLDSSQHADEFRERFAGYSRKRGIDFAGYAGGTRLILHHTAAEKLPEIGCSAIEFDTPRTKFYVTIAPNFSVKAVPEYGYAADAHTIRALLGMMAGTRTRKDTFADYSHSMLTPLRIIFENARKTKNMVFFGNPFGPGNTDWDQEGLAAEHLM